MELLTIPKIAILLNVPESNLRYYRSKFEKYIPELKDGKHRRYKPEALEIFRFIVESFKAGFSSETIENELKKRYSFTIDIENNEQQQASTIQHIETTTQQIEIFQDMLQEIIQSEIMKMKNELAETIENKFDEVIIISRKDKYKKKGFFHKFFKK